MGNMTLTAPVARPDESALVTFCQRLIQTPSVTGSEGTVAELGPRDDAGARLPPGLDRPLRQRGGRDPGRVPRPVGAVRRPHRHGGGGRRPRPGPSRRSGGVIKGGRIYGRGASDMKCALAAMVYGLAPLAARAAGLRGSVFVSGTGLRGDLRGSGPWGRVVEELKPDFVVIGEASALALKRGPAGPGRGGGDRHRQGRPLLQPGRGPERRLPDDGPGAADAAGAPCPRTPFLGHSLLELTDLISTPYPGASGGAAPVPGHLRPAHPARRVRGRRAGAAAPVRARLPGGGPAVRGGWSGSPRPASAATPATWCPAGGSSPPGCWPRTIRWWPRPWPGCAGPAWTRR